MYYNGVLEPSEEAAISHKIVYSTETFGAALSEELAYDLKRIQEQGAKGI